MDDLFLARLQMAWSLGFHIIFAAIGIGMPALMVMSEWRWLRRGDPVAKEVTKRWAKGTAIFFAVGAVSGTALSFELGLLWPAFMEHAGGIIGFPFSLEGFAFFTEAIFLGLYLYGWDKLNRWAHWWCGVAVAISGAASAAFVIMVNAWMNVPTGFTFDAATRTFSDIDPVKAMFSPAWPAQMIHMLIAAYQATAFGSAGIHAFMLLRARKRLGGDAFESAKSGPVAGERSVSAVAFHKEALKICMIVAVTTALLQPIAGDYAAKTVGATQPVKLAAMEGQFETERGAPLRIGGWPNEETRQTTHAIEIPRLLSFLAHADFDAEITGLNDFPEADWPPVAVVHVAFQVMVGLGLTMLAVGLWFAVVSLWGSRPHRKAKRVRTNWTPALLWAIVLVSPAGFIAIEAGWIVTEVGRQPWIISGVMRTSEAVTPMRGLLAPFLTFLMLYLFLAAVTTGLLIHQVRAVERSGAVTRPRKGGPHGD